MAFCTRCGRQLDAGARFCPACGAPVPAVSDTGASGAPDAPARPCSAGSAPGALDGSAAAEPQGPAPADPPARPAALRRRRIGRLVAAALLAVACVAGIVFGVTRALAPQATTVEYGTDKPIELSRLAPITLHGLDGAPLDSFTVRIKYAVDLDGKKIDVSGIEALLVEGGSFAMDDLIADLPNGTYYLEATDADGTRYELPPATIDEGGSDNPVEIEPKPDGSVTDPERLGADGAYLAVLDTLIDDYGEPEVVTVERGNWVAFAHGVCFAGLVDFGDGVERLVVEYGAESVADPSEITASSYRIEIWEYAYDADQAELLWGHDGACTNGGFPYVSWYTDEEGARSLIVPQPGDHGMVDTFIRPAGDGGVDETAFSYDEIDLERMVTYQLMNTGETADLAAGDPTGGYGSATGATGPERVSVNDTIQTVYDTVDELAGRIERADAAASTFADEGAAGAAGGAVSPDEVYTQYAEVASAIVSDHGAPSLEEVPWSNGGDALAGYRVGAGLAFAALVDMDADGVDELVVAYRDAGGAASFADASWTVEVWGCADGTASRLFRGALATDPNHAYLASINLHETADGIVLALSCTPDGSALYLEYGGGDELCAVAEDDVLAATSVLHSYHLDEAPTDVTFGEGYEVDFNNAERTIAAAQNALDALGVA